MFRDFYLSSLKYILSDRNFARFFLLICFSFAPQWQASGASPAGGNPVRSVTPLASGWKFLRAEETNAVRPDFVCAAWMDVSVPHTWNVADGAGGSTNYFRGGCWYARTLPELKLEGRRAFLVFEGASIVTDVYLNGQPLGQHRGAFGAFSFELTSALKSGGSNELRVRVDNSWLPDVPPLGGDFTMFGGLYRPVKLLVTSDVCITPLDHASPGIFLSQRDVSRERATVDVTAKLSRRDQKDAPVVRVTLLDAEGKKVLSAETNGVWSGNDGQAKLTLDMASPHLWNGRKDPYLYAVQTELVRGKQVVDVVTQPLGLRFYRVDPQLGFVLNGEPYPLHGVARHQDREGKGWALSEQDQRDDLAMIKDIGANAVRLAHYPHSRYFYELCDRAGLVVWAEIPLINVVRNTDAFHENTKQQLVEMIRQHGNHPSIVVWGLFNELYHQGPSDPCEDLVGKLQSLAKAEDPTRPTVAASNQRIRKNLNSIPDWLAINSYPGWYGNGKPSDMAGVVHSWQTNNARPVIAVSEYGAGGSLQQHEEWPPQKPSAEGGWHPEEYQAWCHEQQYQALASCPGVWATFVWNMFDFASAGRSEGDTLGRNDKGLVAYDHQSPKDAYYFYKANWNPEPMVHIVSSRFTSRDQTNTTVRVYSNCQQVELKVNGKSLGSLAPNQFKIAAWTSVVLAGGENRIEVVGRSPSGTVKDACVWQLLPAKDGKPRTASRH
jgi:beta-galactosidase